MYFNSGIENSFLARRYGLSRSEEHTSELQSQSNIVCRLLLEKNKLIGERKVEASQAYLEDTTHGRAAGGVADAGDDAHALGRRTHRLGDPRGVGGVSGACWRA